MSFITAEQAYLRANTRINKDVDAELIVLDEYIKKQSDSGSFEGKWIIPQGWTDDHITAMLKLLVDQAGYTVTQVEDGYLLKWYPNAV